MSGPGPGGSGGDRSSRLDWLLDEARRRGLWQVAGLYAVATWFLVQFGVTVVEALGLGGWVVRTLLGMTMAGLPVALAVAWILGSRSGATDRAPDEAAAGADFGPVQKALLVFFVLAGVGLWAWRRTLPPEPVGTAGARGGAAATVAAGRDAETPPPSGSLRDVAVLPFQVLGGDSTEVYLAHGVAEEIRNRLARVPELRVVSRTSSHRYGEPGLAARRVAGELGVRTLLEGGVRRSGDRLRVTVQLVDAAEDVTLWSERYDRPPEDLFAVEDAIARAVARALRVRLGTADGPVSSRVPIAVEAHDLYLLGLHHWNRRTGEELGKALAFFERAVELEPDYADAHAGVARTWVLLPLYAGLRPEEAMPRALAAAERALALDTAASAPHATIGLVKTTFEHDWEGAEASFRRALALNASDATTHQWYGLMLDAVGRHEEAAGHVSQARSLDPLSLIIRETEGIHRLVAGDLETATRLFEEAVASAPDFLFGLRFLSQAYLLAGRVEDAREAVGRRARAGGTDARPLLTLLGAIAGEETPPAAGPALRRAVGTGSLTRYEAAQWAALAGRREEALGWLERAYARRDYLLFLVAVDPTLATLGEEARFRAVTRRMGLVPSKAEERG